MLDVVETIMADPVDRAIAAAKPNARRRPARPWPVCATLMMLALPFLIAEAIAWIALTLTWWAFFGILYLMRPAVLLLGIAAIMSVPMAIVVWQHPDAANGIPFWAFPLGGIGALLFVVGCVGQVDRLRPPDFTDRYPPFRTSRPEEPSPPGRLDADKGSTFRAG
ncbi:hypothetical protein [Rhizobium sp. YS-1r]|uniref:hypothetical protein n=1 Tax=Rhizobium sp. YS-1r TaxID=1532558 RepID=UPI0006895348|nr:hypothetical protein [Rhizobium sp. YS-1r]